MIGVVVYENCYIIWYFLIFNFPGGGKGWWIKATLNLEVSVLSAPRMRVDACRPAVFGLSMPIHGFKRKKRYVVS